MNSHFLRKKSQGWYPLIWCPPLPGYTLLFFQEYYVFCTLKFDFSKCSIFHKKLQPRWYPHGRLYVLGFMIEIIFSISVPTPIYQGCLFVFNIFFHVFSFIASDPHYFSFLFRKIKVFKFIFTIFENSPLRIVPEGDPTFFLKNTRDTIRARFPLDIAPDPG